MRTVKFYTLGCKANQYDTQEIRERFLQADFTELDDGLSADVYVINTCTVTQKADSESLNRIRRSQRENPKAKIIVTGCLTERDHKKISAQAGSILIVKNKDKNNILNLLNAPTRQRANAPTGTALKGISFFKGHTRAFLKIQDGCNNFCSYCKVPLVRGRSRSKCLEDIIKEAERIVRSGYKEIVLTGICLGAYGRDLVQKTALVEVIDALEKIPGLLRIRLSSIEVLDISDELINKLAYSRKLCRHLHIPLQSGDNQILMRMNRRYTQEGFLGLIRKIKDFVPDIAITTDVIVGFPGEDDTGFQNTLELVRAIKPLKVHIFPYSDRKGTPAAVLGNKIDPKAIRQRSLRLKNVARVYSFEYKKQFIGKKLEALIEKKIDCSSGLWEGFTGNYIKVRVHSGRELANRIISLTIKRIEEEYALG